MFNGFSELGSPALGKVLRRTVLTALVVGVVAMVVGLLLAPLASLGIALGVGLAFANLRLLDSGVAKVETKGETNNKVVRRLLGTRSVTRLAVITAIAIGLMLLDGPLGIGMVVGLVTVQIAFVLNVGRVILSTEVQ